MMKLSVDYEFSAREWWEAGGQDLWDGIRAGDSANFVVLDDNIAESWLDAARKIAGWEGGTEYAPHPIAIAEVDPEDQDIY